MTKTRVLRNTSWIALALLVAVAPGLRADGHETSASQDEEVESSEGSDTSAAQLTDKERDELVLLLEGTHQYLLEKVSDLSDEAWVWKPAEDRWSVGEVVEHLAATEGLFGALEEAMAGDAYEGWDELGTTMTAIYKFMPNRLRKFQAPAPFAPSGELGRAEALARLAESRDKWVAFVRETDAPVKMYAAEHPAFGPVNGFQWIVMIGLHNMRHNAQIVEVMAEPAFPH